MGKVKGSPLLFLIIGRFGFSIWPSFHWDYMDDGDCYCLALGWLELTWLKVANG